MRSSKSRSRSKSNRQRSLGNVVNRVFDSSGPEGKVRGTPQQIIEKYLTLARDAQLSNDRVAEQSFLQHAEHYTRMLGEAQREQAERQQQQLLNQQQNHQNQHQYNRNGEEPQPRQADDARDGQNARNEDGGQPRADAQSERREQPEPRPASQPEHAAEAEVTPPARRSRGPRRQAASSADVPSDAAPVASSDALPDAVGTDADSGESRVETPEEKAPASRTRAPRSANSTPRTRRKPAAAAAPAADGAEQG